MAENSRVIRAVPDGRLITQVAAYKLGHRFGFKVVESSWMTVQEAGGTGPRAVIPRDADTLKRFDAQGMIYGDIAGGPWLARTAKRGCRPVICWCFPISGSSPRTSTMPLRRWGARGVKILPLGQAGPFDENGKERAADGRTVLVIRNFRTACSLVFRQR